MAALIKLGSLLRQSALASSASTGSAPALFNAARFMCAGQPADGSKLFVGGEFSCLTLLVLCPLPCLDHQVSVLFIRSCLGYWWSFAEGGVSKLWWGRWRSVYIFQPLSNCQKSFYLLFIHGVSCLFCMCSHCFKIWMLAIHGNLLDRAFILMLFSLPCTVY